MLPGKSIKIFVWGIIATFILFGCSPSSYTERYKKPDTEQKEPSQKESVKFSSTDDPTPQENDKKETKLKEDISAKQISIAVDGDSVFYQDIQQEDFDEEPTEDYPIDIASIMANRDKLKDLGGVLTDREKMLFEVFDYIGTPYKYSGNGKNGIDCSAFTRTIFTKVFGNELPRRARDQYSLGDEIKEKENLQFGDLVFFNTSKRSYPGHVGIYLGDNLFAHSSRSKGVTITSMDNEYYKKRYISGRRVESFK